MSGRVTLTGYGLSVYTRAARMALVAKGVVYDRVECNPFEAEGAATLKSKHPFGRVPVLEHAGFCLWESQAITSYVDEAFDGPALSPERPRARGRMRQVMGIVDSYLYWPLVRQAFSHGVLRPAMGEPANEETKCAGLAAAPGVLSALEDIAADGRVLVPGELTLADCHLWPMLDYFTMLPEGWEMLQAYPALAEWARWVETTAPVRDTRPDLPMT